MPAKGEPLALADIAETNDDPRVQKAMRRLAEDMAPSRISQLVMWHLCAGLDWNTHRPAFGEVGQPLRVDPRPGVRGSAGYESPRVRAPKILFEFAGTDGPVKRWRPNFRRTLQNKMVLGLVADNGIPPRPHAPAVACRVKLKARPRRWCRSWRPTAPARNWIAFGKFSVPVKQEQREARRATISARRCRRESSIAWSVHS